MPPISGKVKKAVEKLVRESLARYGVKVLAIEPAIDSIGEDIIRITLQYGNDDAPLAIPTLNKLVRDTFAVLDTLNEPSYPMYTHNFNVGRKFVDAE